MAFWFGLGVSVIRVLPIFGRSRLDGRRAAYDGPTTQGEGHLLRKEVGRRAIDGKGRTDPEGAEHDLAVAEDGEAEARRVA